MSRYGSYDAKLELRRENADKAIKKTKLSKLTVKDLFEILDVYKGGYLRDSDYAVSSIEYILKM